MSRSPSRAARRCSGRSKPAWATPSRASTRRSTCPTPCTRSSRARTSSATSTASTRRAEYGGIQVFLALDLEGNIRAFYFQKLTGQYGQAPARPGVRQAVRRPQPARLRRLRRRPARAAAGQPRSRRSGIPPPRPRTISAPPCAGPRRTSSSATCSCSADKHRGKKDDA